MTNKLFPAALAASLALLLGAGPSQASEKIKAAGAQPAASQPKAAPKLIDINSATRTELKTLPGIGDAEADRIIAARPYPSKVKLAVDKVLPGATYEALKGRIVAAQKEPSNARPKGASAASAKP